MHPHNKPTQRCPKMKSCMPENVVLAGLIRSDETMRCRIDEKNKRSRKERIEGIEYLNNPREANKDGHSNHYPDA